MAKDPTLSFPSLLPFLNSCAILPTSFGEKGFHLRRWRIAQPSSTVSQLRFSGVFLSSIVNARISMHRPRYHFIITLIISERCDWRGIWGKWPLGRNPDRIWWYRHTILIIFLATSHGSMDNRNSMETYLTGI